MGDDNGRRSAAPAMTEQTADKARRVLAELPDPAQTPPLADRWRPSFTGWTPWLHLPPRIKIDIEIDTRPVAIDRAVEAMTLFDEGSKDDE